MLSITVYSCLYYRTIFASMVSDMISSSTSLRSASFWRGRQVSEVWLYRQWPHRSARPRLSLFPTSQLLCTDHTESRTLQTNYESVLLLLTVSPLPATPGRPAVPLPADHAAGRQEGPGKRGGRVEEEVRDIPEPPATGPEPGAGRPGGAGQCAR